ncbi:glutathione S-transferase family protein [Caenispirillum bisanense]|uniref:Glutathione S-transferase n=1 Tax=Caenispirillum bisanense TaxID=414052 RepID=A0A286G344_9PROT|nr:glutathione S-transferase family protein [Caenispirillum bisanense]SOD89892.1 glutathione S-transferase [Caenispirillum bisanense]
MALKLVIGNKNYSSWSLRPWLALKVKGLAFEEEVIPLYEDGAKARILEVSPAGKVPVLLDAGTLVWDSLAILEYLADRQPALRLWPAEPEARARARCIAAEMHSGFGALRSRMSMNLRKDLSGRVAVEGDLAADIARVQQIWRDTREEFGAGGPFLFGGFTAADAMYAPVVTRFKTYGVAVDAVSAEYMQAILDLPAMQEWYADAAAETWVIPAAEID